MKPVERILTNGGGLFEERDGRLLVKGTDVDLAEVWERTTEAAQEFSVSALHWALHSRGISLNLAGVLVDFVLKYPATLADYYYDESKATLAEPTVAWNPEEKLNETPWSLDQSLQEARDHINILHKEVADLKQQAANLQATAVTHLGQMWTTRTVLSQLLRGLVLDESNIEQYLRQMDDAFANAYRYAEEATSHITDGLIRPHQPPSPELVKILSWTMRDVEAFVESA